MEEVKVPEGKPIRILQWLVKVDDWVKYGKAVLIYRHVEDPSTGIKTKELQLKSRHVGRVRKLCLEKGQVATPGRTLIELEGCNHPVVMKDMCAECGQDLRLLEEGKMNDCARVAMVPNIPELKISNQQAEELGNEDKDRLHKLRKLVLLVDLDQTLIHTTQNQAYASMCENNKNFYIYNLSKNEPTLFTKMRPHCREFLEAISKIYELQIVTFGSRQYAHKIAEFIDPEKKYFAHRILSRDECINPMRKSGNLRHLFPCGDSMVCIIDDRDDVWSAAPNLVLVKKYSYFPGAGDINSPDKLETKKQAIKTATKNDEDMQSLKKRKTETKSVGVANKSKITENLFDSKESSSTQDELPPTEIPSCKNEEKTDEKADAKLAQASENDNSTDEMDTSTISNPESCSSNGSNPNTHSTNSNIQENNSNKKHTVCNKIDASFAKDNHITDDVKNINNKIDDETTTETQSAVKELSNNCNEEKTKDSGDASTTKDNSEKSKDKSTTIALPDNDDYLLHLQHILTEIHRTYYEAYDKFIKKEFDNPPDLREVLPFIRSKVLYGCHIVLTGIIPSNFKAPAEQHKAHIAAKQLGATIDDNVTERTTHLIGGKKGTVKYQEALKQGSVKFVSIEWLMTCSERWDRVAEELYPIPKKRSNTSACNSREGTPPATKSVKWSSDAAAKTYNPVTGKLIKKVLNPTVEVAAAEVARQQERGVPVQIYSSLQDPKVVVPMKVEVPSEPSTSTASAAAARTRKPSMAEMMGIEYSLSSNDLSEMGKEVDDLLSSDEEEDNTESNLGTLIETLQQSSSSEASTPNPSFILKLIWCGVGTGFKYWILNRSQSRERWKLAKREGTPKETKSDDDSSSSSEEEFEHMAELLDHEMHYDEDSRDLDALD